MYLAELEAKVEAVGQASRANQGWFPRTQWGREEPSCGWFQGSHQLIHPHQGAYYREEGASIQFQGKKTVHEAEFAS